ncbi:hypothetical protein [Oribacterium sp. C9]|uniref:hypothetical protein n=1 Tax=Oribacterium sp. C9 TaxID=1943579 RepID=UPI0011159E3B|nr:hypothetical protein [Oribacterium sp. C9]
MKNDDMFRSLYRMVEEYNRLVGPLTEHLHIYDRWNEIESPLLRVAELNDDVLKGVTAFDTSLADHLSFMTGPYRLLLENVASIENMMGTPFAELVHPQVYVPGITTALTTVAATSEQLAQIARPSSGVAEIARYYTQILNDWHIDLGIISSFDSSLADSHFSQLVGMEKAVAGLSGVMAQYDQMTCVSTQIASLQQIGLTDAWKRALTPPELLLGLNDFALKQYEQIQKAEDDQSIAWRLGLIDVASKLVDIQVAWGSEIAVDIGEYVPEAELVIPDFSDLPVILGPAKRDNRDVSEAFEESQLMLITCAGKLIIQKAKAVNDFCKARQMQLLFPESDLVDCAMILGGAFCRDADMLNVVLDTLSKMFIRKPVIDLIGQHRCFGVIKQHQSTNESNKKLITKIQKDIYWHIIGVEDELIKHFAGSDVTIFEEDKVSANVMKALLNVQKDKLYEGAKENNINDGIRNQLSIVYEVKDQTRQGESENGKDSGEVDIMICNNGNPEVIIEGLKLSSFESSKLDAHIKKALVNYDSNGCPLVYILVYATVKAFDDFWGKLIDHMNDYCFPYKNVEGMRDVATVYTDLRHAKAMLNRNGKNVSVHLFAIAVR